MQKIKGKPMPLNLTYPELLAACTPTCNVFVETSRGGSPV